MENRKAAAILAEINHTKIILDQQLDQVSNGTTVHQVANLKAAHSMATENLIEVGDTRAFNLLRETEDAIRNFLAKARRRENLFS